MLKADICLENVNCPILMQFYTGIISEKRKCLHDIQQKIYLHRSITSMLWTS